MRFAVDAHAIGRHLTGNEVYVRSLLNAFAAQDQDDEFIAYVSAESAAQSHPGAAFAPGESRPIRSCAWVSTLPCRSARTAPTCCTCSTPRRSAAPYRWWSASTTSAFWSIPNTSRATAPGSCSGPCGAPCTAPPEILTGSEFSRSSILKVYGDLDEDKVVVVPNAAALGVPPDFARGGRRRRARALPDRRALRALGGRSAAAQESDRPDPRLCPPGARRIRSSSTTWCWPARRPGSRDQVHQAARESGVADRIQFFGFVSDDDLLQLYNACDLFVFPSFYEGFGLPALEAMACGRAVVCSNTSALPEVVDGAAILFDPYAVDEIVRAMADLLLDAELRARMERLGLQRAAHFSWQKTAQRTLEVFHEVVAKSRASQRRLFSDHSSSMNFFSPLSFCSPWLRAAAASRGGPTDRLSRSRTRPCTTASTGRAASAWATSTLTAHKTRRRRLEFRHVRQCRASRLCRSPTGTTRRPPARPLLRRARARHQPRQQEGHREDRRSIRRRTAAQTRRPSIPAGGGKSDLHIPTCARDALTFLYFARREMGQGRVPAGRQGLLRLGLRRDAWSTPARMDIPVADKPVMTDHVNVTVKGPATDFTFEIFFARDAARTPLLIKIPLRVGTFSLELVR